MALGSRHAFVVHGDGGLDEISISGDSSIHEVHDGTVRSFTIHPKDLRIETASEDKIRGGDANDNAGIIRAILAGEKGPRRDIVVMNAAAAMMAGGKAEDMASGASVAREALDSGSAEALLKRWIEASNDTKV